MLAGDRLFNAVAISQEEADSTLDKAPLNYLSR